MIMKKILITGANSYIGTSFETYMKQWPDEYQIDTVDMIGDAWKSTSFKGYDVVYHVAGIAHQKETLENAHSYYEINRNLAIATAKKAKSSGVKQFILLSSMSVYGMETGVITKDTIPNPKSHYGKSKLQAEKIEKLNSETFKVTILRPPMVYGKNCKGNFQSIIKLVKLLPVFPKIRNERSMIYIDNLCAFVKMCVDNELSGLYFPQNREYACTSDVAYIISNELGKKVYFSSFLGKIISIFGRFFTITRKGFGSLIYKDMEVHDFKYAKIENDVSVSNCFRNDNKRKKVLFVATVVREHINVFHVPFLKLFKEFGWETSVAAKNDYFENASACHIDYCDNYYDIPFERSPFKKNNLKSYKALKRIIDAGNYDIIHCHTPVGAMIARLAARNARKKGTKVIYTAHGFHFYKGSPLKNWLIYFPAEWLLSVFTDTLITINKEDYKFARKALLSKEVVFVPGVGISIEKYHKDHSTKNELLKEFELDDNVFIITSVGELIERKNFKTLIKAVKLIENENIVCLICGRGDLEDVLKKQVSDLGLQEKIKFLGFRKDINRILHGSDVFVFPSYQEGLPVAMMEAMAAGLPVIASNIRGNSDLIKNNLNGFLTDIDDYKSISARIIELMTNNEKRKIMGQNAVKNIEQYSINKVMKRMRKIYFK